MARDSILRQVSWTGISLLAARVASFGATVMLARMLRPSEFGLYVVAMTYVVLLTPVMDFGVSGLVFRASSRDSNSGLTLGMARRKSASWMLFLGLAAVVGVTFADQEPVSWAVVLVLAAIGQVLVELATAEAQGTGMAARAAMVRVGAALSQSIAVVAAVLWMPTWFSAVIAIAGLRLAAGLLSGVPFGVGEAPDPRDARALGVMGLIITCYVRSDIVMLSQLGVPSAEVAVYGSTYNVLVAAQLIPVAISTAAFRRFAGSLESAQVTYVPTAVLMSACCGVVAKALAIRPEIPLNLFGAYYATSATDAAGLYPALAPMATAMLAVSVLQGRDRERLVIAIIAAALVVNVTAHFALIPSLGLRGAAIATVVTESFVGVAATFAVWRAGLPSFVAGALALGLAATVSAIWPRASMCLLTALVFILWRYRGYIGLRIRPQIRA